MITPEYVTEYIRAVCERLDRGLPATWPLMARCARPFCVPLSVSLALSCGHGDREIAPVAPPADASQAVSGEPDKKLSRRERVTKAMESGELHVGKGYGLYGAPFPRKQPRPPGPRLSHYTKVDGGAMKVSVVRRTIARATPQVMKCYRAELERAPHIEGMLVTQYKVSGQGAVVEAALIESTLKGPALEKCVLDTIRGIALPPTEDGQPVVATTRIRFVKHGD